MDTTPRLAADILIATIAAAQDRSDIDKDRAAKLGEAYAAIYKAIVEARKNH